MKIGCVILAGGKSSRMGQDKALLEIDGKSFIKQLTETLNFFEEKYIARGNNSNILDVTWPMIQDIYPEHGPIGGIHAALTKCDSDAVLFVSCDMPLIKKALIQQLCEAMTSEYDAVVVKEKNGRIHPLCAIYKKSVVNLFEQQILSNNNRLMLALGKMKVKYITVDEAQQLSNINTPNDYLALQKI